MTADEWTRLYEALQMLIVETKACGLPTFNLEKQVGYMLDHCPIPQPQKMEV